MPAPLLYLTHRVPYPPDKGDRIRNWNVLRFLARRAPVHLACLADEPVADDTRRILSETCARVGVVPLDQQRWLRAVGTVLAGWSISEGAFSSGELRELLRSWVKQTEFSAAIASASSLAPYLRLPELRHIPAVVDLV